MNFFAPLLAELRREEDSDPEPTPRFSTEWTAWLYRQLDRSRQRTEIAEAVLLTLDPADPAPVAALGLEEFLAWARRQSWPTPALRIARLFAAAGAAPL